MFVSADRVNGTKAARSRLRKLGGAKDECFASLRAIQQRRNDMIERIKTLTQSAEQKRIDIARVNWTGIPAGHTRQKDREQMERELAEFEDDISSLQADVARLQAEEKAMQEITAGFSDPFDKLCRHIGVRADVVSISGGRVKLIEADDPKYKKLTDIRAQRRELSATIQKARGAYLTPEECVTQFSQFANDQEKYVRVKLDYFAAHDRQGGANLDELNNMGVGFVKLLLGDEFDKRLASTFKNIVGDKAISATQLLAKEKDLSGKLRAIEISEERAVMALEDQGFSVARRRDIDPALVWELWNEQ